MQIGRMASAILFTAVILPIVTNIGTYVEYRYFSHMYEKEVACKDAHRMAETHNPIGNYLFYLGKKNAGQFYNSNCR